MVMLIMNSNGDGAGDDKNDSKYDESGDHDHNIHNSGERFGDSGRCRNVVGSGGGGGEKDGINDGHCRLSGAGWIAHGYYL